MKLQLLLTTFCLVNFSNAQEDFVLPNATRPESYTVIITTNVPQASRQFTGILSVLIRVVEDTNEIFLHSRDHTILDYQLYDMSRPGAAPLDNVNLVKTGDVIKISSEQILQRDLLYDLHISFRGSLVLVSDGFFRSDYVENLNGSDRFT
jgi:Peptidase M1 N-terminal domain